MFKLVHYIEWSTVQRLRNHFSRSVETWACVFGNPFEALFDQLHLGHVGSRPAPDNFKGSLDSICLTRQRRPRTPAAISTSGPSSCADTGASAASTSRKPPLPSETHALIMQAAVAVMMRLLCCCSLLNAQQGRTDAERAATGIIR